MATKMNLFMDTEFTHFAGPNDDPAQLISIGVVAEDGRQFYAEVDKFRTALCSDFVISTVLTLLECGEKVKGAPEVARCLKDYIEGFGEECLIWSDAVSYDWPLIVDLFADTGTQWPTNLVKKPRSVQSLQQGRYQAFLRHQEDLLASPSCRRHHALDDALAMREAWLKSSE